MEATATREKLLIHSNAPWAPTGYGNQCGLFAPLLNERYKLGISSFYGLEGAPLRWEDIPVLPGLGGEYGNASLPQHAAQFFGSPRGGIVLTLMDVWVLDPDAIRTLDAACWTPVDHQPAPPQVLDFFARSDAIPVAMSRFGEQQLCSAGLDPLYVPHAVDTGTFKAQDQTQARGESFPPDAFVVGIVAANKGRPSRKGFTQAFRAFAKFAQEHENAYLYLHTVMDPALAAGEHIAGILNSLGVPQDRVRIADQYAMLYRPYSPVDMAKVYSAFDVLVNVSHGEGFGIPIIEAQACGIPAVVTDFSAMPEVCGAGWHVKHEPFWTGQNSWMTIPDVTDIVAALEECYRLPATQRAKLKKAARRHALNYDVQRVCKTFMLPALREARARFAARRPVSVAPRLKAAA